MRSTLEMIMVRRKLVIEILLLPIIVYTSGVLMLSTFNLGTYLGTFLRYIYYYVVC